MASEKNFEELRQSLETAKEHPLDTGWDIYHYLKANVENMESQEARTLLACYIKMELEKPSLLHSLMLSVALRMAKRFTDFNFARFFDMWTYSGIARITGYVDFYDDVHKHYHIYDSFSRHFVAIDPHIAPIVGGFVEFTPIIPREGRFKTAVIHRTMKEQEGLASFGMYEAVVMRVNAKVGFFQYKITSAIRRTEEGMIADYGTAFLGTESLTEGQRVGLLLFLKRDKDRIKRNYVARIISKNQ